MPAMTLRRLMAWGDSTRIEFPMLRSLLRLGVRSVFVKL